MCLIPDAPKARIVSNTDRAGDAAAAASMMRRRGATGFQSSIMGGNDSAQPSLARQMLGMG